MHNSEWSLVFFTLLGQLSAGVLFSLMIFSITGFSNKVRESQRIFKVSIYIATILIILALIISFLHLSSPLASIYALSNLKQSWLSREILLVSVFTAFLGFLSIYVYRSNTKKQITVFLLLATIIGFLMIYSMAKIYMLPTVPAWDTPITLINFFGSGLITGSAFFLLVYYQITGETTENKIHAKTGKIYITIIGIVLASRALAIFTSCFTEIVSRSAFAPSQLLVTEFFVSWIFWLLGLGLILWQIFSPVKKIKTFLNFFYLAFICFVMAEILYRSLFYSSFYRVGI